MGHRGHNTGKSVSGKLTRDLDSIDRAIDLRVKVLAIVSAICKKYVLS